MVVLADRPCASLIATGRTFGPGVVETETVATKVNVFPAPEKACAADPPIADRSAVTLIPVLVGSLPGETTTVSVELSPGCTPSGLAEPVPERTAQLFVVDELFRGLGAPCTKSLALLSVSRQPLFFLMAAVGLVRVGAGEPSEQFAPSYPM